MTIWAMAFRLKAFALHLLISATVLSVSLGTLYLGWYHWPGWYLTGVSGVTAVLAGVDVVLGPLLTLVIASPRKPRRELARDIAVIGAIQLAALTYGTTQLWNGRPLYYAFSDNCLPIPRISPPRARATPHCRRTGTACRDGFGCRCPPIPLSATSSRVPRLRAASMSPACRNISSRGSAVCRRCAHN